MAPGPVIIDLTLSDSEQEQPQPQLQPQPRTTPQQPHKTLTSPAQRTQRPAFVSQRARAATAPNPIAVPDSHRFNSTTDSIDGGDSEDSSDFDEISPAIFSFMARKSKTGPVHMLSAKGENDGSVTNGQGNMRPLHIQTESQRTVQPALASTNTRAAISPNTTPLAAPFDQAIVSAVARQDDTGPAHILNTGVKNGSTVASVQGNLQPLHAPTEPSNGAPAPSMGRMTGPSLRSALKRTPRNNMPPARDIASPPQATNDASGTTLQHLTREIGTAPSMRRDGIDQQAATETDSASCLAPAPTPAPAPALAPVSAQSQDTRSPVPRIHHVQQPLPHEPPLGHSAIGAKQNNPSYSQKRKSKSSFSDLVHASKRTRLSGGSTDQVSTPKVHSFAQSHADSRSNTSKNWHQSSDLSPARKISMSHVQPAPASAPSKASQHQSSDTTVQRKASVFHGLAPLPSSHKTNSLRASGTVASYARPSIVKKPGENISQIVRSTDKHNASQTPAANLLVDSSLRKAKKHIAIKSLRLKKRPNATLGQPMSSGDDNLLIHLKEVVGLRWAEIEKWFPGRRWQSLQSRYSTQFSPLALMRKSQQNLGVSGTDSNTDAPRRSRVKSAVRTASSAIDASAPLETMTQSEDQATRQLCHIRRQPPYDRLLRNRELGLVSLRAHPTSLQGNLSGHFFSKLRPLRYMDNASGDVSTVAWSPDPRNTHLFAAGSVAVVDLDSMQYNKARNLVIGDAISGKVKELAEHHIPRPTTTTGANASEAMRQSQDSVLYTTVQAVAFAPHGRTMYSVSCDNCLNIYKVSNRDVLKTRLVQQSKHIAEVDLLAVSSTGLVATGCRSSRQGSIQVFRKKGDPLPLSPQKLALQKYPSALRWGQAYQHANYLLCGYSYEAERIYVEDEIRDKEGETTLWDVTAERMIEIGTNNANVFDVAWNPHASSASSIFAVASGITSRVNRGMHSVIRVYDPKQNRAQQLVELECPAWDINDVLYSPYDNHMIAAGSTDGKVYVWDIRKTKRDQAPMTVLEHGESLSVLPHGHPRWEVDTGIRFLSWGGDRTSLFSGSSDGVVKCWNPYRADEDKHIRDVAKFQSAVMSGAFSPDNCSLLIGEDASRLNLLTIGNREDDGEEEKSATERFTVHESFSVRHQASNPTGQDDDAKTLTKQLVESERIVFRPMGALPLRQAVQGPNYNGPYSKDPEARQLRDKAACFQERALWSYEKHKKLVERSDHVEPCTLDCNYRSSNDDEHLPESTSFGGGGGGGADDAGPFLDRKPFALREPLRPGLEAQKRGLNAVCSHCGFAARADDGASGSGSVSGSMPPSLCAKCRFPCLRCARPVTVSRRVRALECDHCGLCWRIGVLGYEVLNDDGDGDGASLGIERGQEQGPAVAAYAAAASVACSMNPAMEGAEIEVEPGIWNLGDEERERHFLSF